MAETVNLSAITRPAVLSAIEEFDDVGQEAFLRRRGYAEARNFRLVHRGHFYDSKAITGVAHGYATSYFVNSSEFSGGLATVADCLNNLGFVVDHGSKHARGGLLWELETTQAFTREGRSAAYKFVVLLWAVMRADKYPGLTHFSEVRKELDELLVPFAMAKSAPSPAGVGGDLRAARIRNIHLVILVSVMGYRRGIDPSRGSRLVDARPESVLGYWKTPAQQHREA